MSHSATAGALGLGVLTVGRVGAGSGCRYLTEQVAAGKDDFAELSPEQALSYYSDTKAHGESPGRWVGRGLGTLGLAGPVSATELENLVGHARHPHFDDILRARAMELLTDKTLSAVQRTAGLNAAQKDLYLGRGYATYESAEDRAARAVEDLGDDADEASRDAVRAQVLAEGDRQAVAGYELTFTPVKSVSVLGVLGGEAVWAQVMNAHRVAVGTALAYVQDHAAYSRAGVNGVRQIDTHGLVIAAFEHRMSREADPNIHTHAIVANRVLCTDGKWRTVDGRAVYAASVGARAVYEQALETELGQRLGVRFSADERRTIREVHGVPLAVIEQFSKRDAAIKKAIAEHVDGVVRPGRGWHKLAKVFTLSTRPGKKGPESTAAAIERWQRELAGAGVDPAALLATVTHPAERQQQPRDDRQILADAVAVLNQTRAVWTRHHAVLAVSRVVPPTPGQPFPDHQQDVERLVGQLLADAVQVTPPDVLTVGATLQRASDGQSVFTAHADVLYAARSTVDAEQRILSALGDVDAPLIAAVELAPTAARHQLGDDQFAAVYDALTTGSRVSAIVGPAGAGKTYVQRAIAAAWATRSADADHPGAAAVLALAPSQIAASVLSESISAPAQNIAKWLHEHTKQTKKAAAAQARGKRYDPDPAWTLRPGQLVILDEAGMVTTRELDAVLTAVRRAGAKLLLVGDDKQLGAIGAGGMFATIVNRTHAPVLSTVRRFRDEHGRLREWECSASLGLRERDLDAVAEYERRGRLHAGPLTRMEETSYRAWLSDHLAFEQADAAVTPVPGMTVTAKTGRVALLMADTEAAAAALSARARADLVSKGLVERGGVALADGNHAGVGDLIVTRLNERALRAEQGEGFVANRDTWRVVARGRDGSLTVTSVTGGARELRLPAIYVAASVQLAYAGTVHSAQGRTVTTARGLVTESTSAQALYVMMTRGELSNDAYVVTDDEQREAHQRWPEQHHLSVLAAILERDDRPAASVADVEADLYDQTSSVARLRIIFGDLSTVVRGSSYEAIITEHAGADAAARAVSDPAWATLVRALGAAQTLGWDSCDLLIQAITQRELGTATDVAAVLHWRCENITGRWREAPSRPGSAALNWAEQAAGIIAIARASHPSVSAVSGDAAVALVQVAEAIDNRADALAALLAIRAEQGQSGGYESGQQPVWLGALGPVATAGREVAARREAWLRNARAVALYQDATGYKPAGADPIGPRPPAGDVEAVDLWNAARAALADAPITATMRAMATDRLQRWVAEALTAEADAQPAYVGHELRAVSLRARAQRTRVNRLRHELTAAEGHLASATGRRWRRDDAAIDSLQRTRDQVTGRLGRAEQTLATIDRDLSSATRMHQAWQDWEQSSRDIRERGRLAAQELSLRYITVATPDPIQQNKVSRPALAPALAPAVTVASAPPVVDVVQTALLQEQYAIQAAAAEWFSARLDQRWAAGYLTRRGLGGTAKTARAGYAPSRPGEWTLLLDHLRSQGYSDGAIETAGLATRSSRGQLIDRFRDRVILPVLDDHDRPIGFLGRKPLRDANPDNPKYLNPTSTPLYDKSKVMYGLDADAAARLAAGARAIIVEGPMDRLAIRLAAADLVPLATCGTALTDAHLDLLAHHTALDSVILGFDADQAGRKATLAAGRKLIARGVDAPAIELFTAPAGADPAGILEAEGTASLAAALADDHHHGTLLDLLVDDSINRHDWANRPLRDLPIADTAAAEAIRLIGDSFRGAHSLTPELVAAQSHRLITRIADRCGVPVTQLWMQLADVITRDADDSPYSDWSLDFEGAADVDVDVDPDDCRGEPEPLGLGVGAAVDDDSPDSDPYLF